MVTEAVQGTSSLIDDFAAVAEVLVVKWNEDHEAECRGRLIVEVCGPDNRDEEKEVQLFADVGTPLRPDRMLLLAVRFVPGRGLVGSNLLLPAFGESTASIERLTYVIANFRPRI